jgi:hypothetical protein
MSAKFDFIEREYGGYTIDKVRLLRIPLKGAGILKPFSAKPLTEDPYHLGMELALSNPLTGARRVLKLDKDYVLRADLDRTGGVSGPKGTIGMSVEIPKHLQGKLTLGQLIENNRQYHLNVLNRPLEKYSLACSNCQDFTRNALISSGFELSAEQRAFTDQNASSLVAPKYRPFLDTVTNSAAWISNKTDSFTAPPSQRINYHTQQ